MQPPVWIFRSGCTPYAASTHVHNWIRLSYPITLLSYMVCFRYWNTCLNFSLSSFVLVVTLVQRNYIAGSMSGLLLFATHSNFATMEWKMSAYFLSRLVELSSTFCRTFIFGDYILVLISSPKNQFITQCNPSQIKIISHLLINLCPFPGTCVYSPLILWGCQKS